MTLSGDSATVTSIKRKGDEELRVVITLKALKGTSSDYSPMLMRQSGIRWMALQSGTAVRMRNTMSCAFTGMRNFKYGKTGKRNEIQS